MSTTPSAYEAELSSLLQDGRFGDALAASVSAREQAARAPFRGKDLSVFTTTLAVWRKNNELAKRLLSDRSKMGADTAIWQALAPTVAFAQFVLPGANDCTPAEALMKPRDE